VADVNELFKQAMHERQPEGFVRWELADENGRTVAHEAAEFGKLPEGFDMWHLADKNGKTVRDLYNEREKRRKTRA
jgi:hypothetical protein